MTTPVFPGMFTPAVEEMTFDGETYEPEHDQARLTGQMARVWEVMRDGTWRTFHEIQEQTGDRSDAAISARLRDLRKTEFGGYTVERRSRGDRARGLWEYRVTPSAERG
jgi:hypothetical protein